MNNVCTEGTCQSLKSQEQIVTVHKQKLIKCALGLLELAKGTYPELHAI